MKTVSLAKANRVRNLLEDKILPDIVNRFTDALTIQVLISTDKDSLVKVMAERQTLASKLLIDRNNVTNAIGQLRLIIAKANHESGLDILLTQIKTTERELSFRKGILPLAESAHSVDYIASSLGLLHESFKSGPSSNLYGRSTHATHSDIIAIPDGFDKETLLTSIADIEADIREFEETRNTKNYQTTVSLSDDLVKVLETFKVI